MNEFENRLRSTLDQETVEISAAPTLADDMVARGSRVRRRRRIISGAAAVAVVAALAPVWHTISTSGSEIAPSGRSLIHHSTAPDTEPGNALPKWRTAAVAVVHTSQPSPVVTNLRAGRHARYDRVVVDISGALTGYRVGYVSKLVGGESGKPIHLQGNAFLAVRLSPAVAHGEAGHPLYMGPRRQVLGMPMLLGTALTEDFEDNVSFGLALERHTDFRVFTLSGPSRLVIDIRH
jgi:hypothetical protein